MQKAAMRLVFGLAATLVAATALAAADFYVAPGGDDSNPGTEARPFATLDRARIAVGGRVAAGLDGDLTVLLRGGTYRIRQTVIFGLADSGGNGHSITYAAYPGETPVLSSGVAVTGWKRVEGELPGLPEAARGRVWVADLPEGLDRFLTLYDGDSRLPRARGNGTTPAKRYPKARAPGWRTKLEFRPGTLRAWPNLADVEILIVPQYPWVSNLLPLAEVDVSAGIAQTAVAATYPMGQVFFSRFPNGTLWVENVLEALDAPGEWVLNMQQRKLYLWPTGEKPSDAIVAPCLTELIRIEGGIDYDGPVDKPVRNVRFQGLTFTHGDRWPWEPDKVGWGLQHDWEMFDRPTALVRFRGAEKCAVQRCRFANSGGTAVRLDLHCQRNRIVGNHIEHLGGAGILLAGYGPGTKDVNRQNTVTDNRIHHVGQLLWHSLGIFAWQSGENHIAHNLIHHTSYTAIVVSGRIHWSPSGEEECSKTIRWAEIERAAPELQSGASWRDRERFLHARQNLVELNDIHHTMQILGDGNCIYISGCGGGNIVRRNYLHDVDSTNVNANIRCDDDQHETRLEENVIFRCCGEGFISKGNNAIVNNFVVDLRSHTTAGLTCEHQRGYLVFPYSSPKDSVIERNVLLSRTKGQRLLTEGTQHAPPRTARFRDCKADHNLYFNTADPDWGKRHLEAQRPFGVELHSLSADPRFIDAEAGDFRFEPDSSAKKLGIESIDLSTAGPRT